MNKEQDKETTWKPKTLTIYDRSPNGDFEALEEFVNTVLRMARQTELDRSAFRYNRLSGGSNKGEEMAWVSFTVYQQQSYRDWVNLVDGFTTFEVNSV